MTSHVTRMNGITSLETALQLNTRTISRDGNEGTQAHQGTVCRQPAETIHGALKFLASLKMLGFEVDVICAEPV